MIHVLAKLTIDPARRQAFLKSFADLRPLVLAEEGCIEYDVAVDQPTDLPPQELLGDGAVMVVEKWESVEKLKAHLVAPHMEAWRESLGETLRDVSLHVLK